MASRSPAQIEAQKAAALARARSELQGASQTASIESTPPGYITGFKIVLTPEYKIDIYPGVLNVGGLRVELATKYTLRPEDEMMARLSRSWWYLYVDKLGGFYADVIPPEFKPEWMAYYHKNHPWRNIGRYFVCDDHLCRYAANWQQASEQTVYVAPANFGGIANYYCTGTDDQILINAAIRYLHEAYDGGEVKLIRGSYSYTKIDINYSDIYISGEGAKTLLVRNGTSYGIHILGSVSDPVENVTIDNLGFTQSDTSTSSMVFSDNADNIRVTRNFFYDLNGGAIELDSGSTTLHTVSENTILGFGYGADCTAIGGEGLDVSNNIINGKSDSITIAYNVYGISAAKANGNTVYKIKSSGNVHGISIGDGAYVAENNIVASLETTGAAATCRGLEITSLGANCVMSGNWVASIVAATNANASGIYSDGMSCVISSNSISSSDQYGIYETGSNNSITGNYCYNNGSDTGIANTNGNNFYDGGTDTQVYSNSWQQPVAGEPSLGTPHKNATPINLFTTATAITATTTPITLTSTQYPVGTNMIYVSGAIINAPPTNNVQIQDVASNIWTIARNYSTAITWLNGLVSISSTMGFKVVCSTGVSLCLRLTGMAHWE